MRWPTVTLILTLPLMLPFGAVLAQRSDTLPERLTGKWEAQNMDRFTYNGVETIVFEGSRTPGPVQGHVTHQGVVCSAEDEPFKGTWDGKVLKFDTEFKAMTNRPSTCVGQNTYALERKVGKDAFTGTIRSKGGNMLNVSVSP